MKKFFKVFLTLLAALYFLALAGLYTFQRSALYIPPQIYLTPAGVNLESVIEVTDPTDGANIIGWWLPSKEEGAPTVMYFHGNGSAVYSANDVYRTLQTKGYGVFALAYPGYPGRAGMTTQQSLTEAAIAGYDFVRSQGAQAEKIVFYGTSLGAGVAAQLSAHRRPAHIIMEAPFTSAADMAQLRFPIFPAALLTKDKFHSDLALAGSQIPLTWLHGTDDRVIPLSVGETLYENYDGPKTSHIIDGGLHNNLWYLGGQDIILTVLSQH